MNLLEKTLNLSYWKRVKIAFQYVMPQKYLTQAAGWLAKQQWGVVTHFIIKLFAKKYQINMQEAAKPEFSDYATFNEFFIRPLKEGVRKINEDSTALCFPADGKISQCGHIFDETMLQAKEHSFSLKDLLAGDEELTQAFKNGDFATIYLSPRDYHRVHMPCDATLRKMIYVPGDLFSVNPFLNEHIPNLLARNERVICVFDTEFGQMVQILVGATITASISTAWAGVINPPRPNSVQTWHYDGSIKLSKGQEMGAFQLGSTVINLFQQDRVTFPQDLTVDSETRVGEILAYKK
ncbi:archaetidylserine decarboxylase [Pasteurellaceae bacterium 22721_9_1]